MESVLASVNHKSFKSIIIRRFTSVKKDPFASVAWEKREVAIADESGQILFSQPKVEVPTSWSQMATNIVASKYFYGDLRSSSRERSVKQLIGRVVDTIGQWVTKDNYFPMPAERETFSNELCYLLLNQYASFNSPVWFNVGIQPEPQCSACFIIAVEDTIDGLLDLQTLEGKLFKYGSGTGTNLSSLRSSREKLSGGGRPSGPVSFMRAFDAWASVIKSGGKTRRAAKMQILNVTHPDIKEFISAKANEEKKAWALIEQGYDGSFAASGGAYDSVSLQNCNTSVRVSAAFMEAVKTNQEFKTIRTVDQNECETLDAREILRLIAECSHICGDPGLQFDDTINAWHTCPNSGRINGSNPCSEYMHLDNSACNLSSINLLKFLDKDQSFDLDGFCHAVSVMITAQDSLIDNSSYPTAKIKQCARDFRQLGLGYTNLGALLMNLGLAYDSDAGRAWAAHLTSIMTGQAYLTSALIASRLGAFRGYQKNKDAMLGVIAQHLGAATDLASDLVPESLAASSVRIWQQALDLGRQFGFRNSQTTVLAPTGTISFMMDCDTTGIEPEISLIKYKKLVSGGYLKMVNHSVPRALELLGYSGDDRRQILEYIENQGTVEGAPKFKDEHLSVFDCALKSKNGSRIIHYLGHLKMMAATQPFLSGAISKTVNLPEQTTVDEIFEIYLKAWELGLKAVALYRDNSKKTQPMSGVKSGSIDLARSAKPIRRRLPNERQALTHKFSIAGLEGYLTIGLYENGVPGEIFLVVAKEGSTLSGMMDAFATSISIALQYGVPLIDLVRKFTHMRFEPAGFTDNKDVPMAKSIVDYVFRYIGLKYLTIDEQESLGLRKGAALATTEAEPVSGINAKTPTILNATSIGFDDAPPCLSCGSGMMVRAGACYVCLNCGAQGGCS